jgi:hypothetical protein
VIYVFIKYKHSILIGIQIGSQTRPMHFEKHDQGMKTFANALTLEFQKPSVDMYSLLR